MKRLCHFIFDTNFVATLCFAIKSRTTSAFLCRGKIQARFESGSKLVGGGRKCFVGVPLKGNGSLRKAVTVIGAGQNAELNLAGAIIGRGAVVSAGPGARIFIGEGTYLNDGCQVLASKEIRIGRGCAISWNVTIIDDDGHGIKPPPYSASVAIQDKVWIGCNVTVLKGVTIGEGSVVAAGAVVTESFPARSLIGGVPAKLIRSNVSWDSASPGEPT